MDAGLEGVVAARTVLSDVDGQAGRLIIRGHRVEDLAASASYEETVHLLWKGFFPELPDVAELKHRLGQARVHAFQRMQPVFAVMAKQPPMEAVRTALALGQDGEDLNTAITALASALVATAAVSRMQSDAAPIAPDASLSQAEDLLHMISGTRPDAELAAGMNAYLVTVSEHGLNASTFVARSVASTQAGLLSAVIGGACALKGPLHGGAPGPVLDMLDDIGALENAEDWILTAMARGDRLMGFGHRIYRVRDPRADALKAAASELPQSAGRLQLAQDIETEILTKLAQKKPNRKLETNVEYYTAILLEALGVPRSAFTCVFACARAAGWIAHAQEQLETKRIVRPASEYVGPEAMELA
ncbi:MAG: citrate synthase/methylcitrate synthase [Henriciella sp.]|nr:citrate synthase/methylcitrate synthase [Henriciella sp.]